MPGIPHVLHPASRAASRPATSPPSTGPAALTGPAPEDLRSSSAANVQGDAALLAAARRKPGRPPGDGPAGDPVAGYDAAAGHAGGSTFCADETFAVPRTGAPR
ncbi:hypothetical protein [Streptomyces sp. YIM 98790]|uniref:hypothetical protein n=1 Tax=Streptomyces sp. YIM 98790 TaxID=2689077 RepID=UPI001409D207|nr:hypothetical protein [Streptomyces sp. YIM 98790]